MACRTSSARPARTSPATRAPCEGVCGALRPCTILHFEHPHGVSSAMVHVMYIPSCCADCCVPAAKLLTWRLLRAGCRQRASAPSVRCPAARRPALRSTASTRHVPVLMFVLVSVVCLVTDCGRCIQAVSFHACTAVSCVHGQAAWAIHETTTHPEAEKSRSYEAQVDKAASRPL